MVSDAVAILNLPRNALIKANLGKSEYGTAMLAAASRVMQLSAKDQIGIEKIKRSVELLAERNLLGFDVCTSPDDPQDRAYTVAKAVLVRI